MGLSKKRSHNLVLGKKLIVKGSEKRGKNSRDDTSSEVIHDSHEGSEIIIGLVEAVGTRTDEVISQITNCLRPYHYSVEVISISADVMPSILKINTSARSREENRIRRMMDYGDLIRKVFRDNSILSLGATSLINLKRQTIERQQYTAETWPGYAKRTAFVIKTLKRPEEVEMLRRVYGSGFYLVGIHTEEDRRIESLKDKGVSSKAAKKFSSRDADGKTDYGQKASATYHLADFFMHFEDSIDSLKDHAERVIKLLFGHPHITPLFDEYAMFMAFSASLRSADLARQVGAVIARDYEILAAGANDCPRKGGGLYWTKYDKKKRSFATDSPRGTDIERGYDSNSREKNAIIDQITKKLSEKGLDRKVIRQSLEKSRVVEITEYGRSVHAEMEALMHCARTNTSTKGATLYCTTFPCHNCAKHIVAAGIERVVYVEPYPKSKALELHDDSISNSSGDSAEKVVFEPFQGVGPRRFFDLFSMRLGLGSQLERKDKSGEKVEWTKEQAEPRIRLSPLASLGHERAATEACNRKIERLDKKLGKKLRSAKLDDVRSLLKRSGK
ncbi:MAG: cytidine deaminase [Planctomycetes bacterium]|nr:cytidine deaminase [Planctomycetota bacterium]